MSWRIHTGDALGVLRGMDAESAQCCVTSPPYWGLRDYGHIGQLGLERTPEEYVEKLVAVFREVWRVLRSDGTLWINLGDSYNAYNGAAGPGSKLSDTQTEQRPKLETGYGLQCRTLKPKDLIGIPWRVAFALQADGWWLRSDVIEEVELFCPCGCGYILEERIWRYSQDRDIIWKKPNPMPESVTDRPTKAHEYLFLLTKSARYHYDADAIREEWKDASIKRDLRGYDGTFYGRTRTAAIGDKRDKGLDGGKGNHSGRNARSVWTIPTQPYPGAHFATFPEKLVEPCIRAGAAAKTCRDCGAPWERLTEKSKELDIRAKGSTFDKGKTGARNGGDRTQTGPRFLNKTASFQPTCDHDIEIVPSLVLDPFAGSGTVGVVALGLGRRFLGIELNPESVELATRRIEEDAPLFNRIPQEVGGPDDPRKGGS